MRHRNDCLLPDDTGSADLMTHLTANDGLQHRRGSPIKLVVSSWGVSKGDFSYTQDNYFCIQHEQSQLVPGRQDQLLVRRLRLVHMP